MTSSKTAASAGLLTQVAGERRTGVLVVGGHPGGSVYLLEGRVCYAESPASPGAGELLVSSGRLAPRTWQNALDQGTAAGEVGRLLVDQGHLTRGELELCVLGAAYDAAYFALAQTGAPVEFLDGARHWLGAVVHIDPAAVIKEVRRRIRLLQAIFPDPRVDTAEVTLAPRPPREQITVTAPQWELLVHADGQRTPADLAQLLGRAGYATVQELRHLAALGLIELPRVRGDAPEFIRLPRVQGPAVGLRRPTAQVADAPTVPKSGGVPVFPAVTAPPEPAVAGGPTQPWAAAPPPQTTATDPPAQATATDSPAHPPVAGLPPRPPVDEGDVGSVAGRPPKLARRRPGARLPTELAAEPPPAHPGVDEFVLKRLRTALRALR